MSRPGALSTSVAGEGYCVCQVVCFDVHLHICLGALFSTDFAYPYFCCFVSSGDCVSSDFHHGFDLFIKLLHMFRIGKDNSPVFHNRRFGLSNISCFEQWLNFRFGEYIIIFQSLPIRVKFVVNVRRCSC